MDRNSRITVYAGVNFIVAPLLNLTLDNRLEFQRQLENNGIQLSDLRFDNQKLIGTRIANMPLQISIGALGPQVGQILIVAPELRNRSVEGFSHEANDVASIFSQIWPQRQIVGCDATVRDLYDSTEQHAFQELWETRLNQPTEGLQLFNRPVLGGGLRFVMPPTSNDPGEPLIEVKIESFLNDTHKLFLEAQVTWNRPQPPGTALDPENRLTFVDNFLQNEVVRFIMEG